MTLPSSGPISLGQIADEFSISRQAGFPSAYYGKGGAPSSGPLSFADFYGRSAYIPPSLSVSPNTAQGFASAPPNSGVVTTNPVTATVSNGQAPFSYNWTITGTGWTINGGTTSSASFSRNVTIGQDVLATATCTVTDGRGNTASANCSVEAARS